MKESTWHGAFAQEENLKKNVIRSIGVHQEVQKSIKTKKADSVRLLF